MHFKNTCPKCGAITQCRCMDCNKTETHELCEECKTITTSYGEWKPIGQANPKEGILK